MDRASLSFTGGMSFDVSVDGHNFTIDASSEHGGADLGPRPKPLMLASLAGCTGMDVVSILTKMRQTWTRFDVRAQARMTDEHPKTYQDILVTFDIEGDVDPDRLARAVALSRDRYCGVNAMLSAHTTITVEIRLNGQLQTSPPPA